MEEARRLTERERQCLRLVHSHFSSKQIARELGIKPGTVDRHCENATRKLQADSRVDAALRLMALEVGIGNGSQYDPLPIANRGDQTLDRQAERIADDQDFRHPASRQLGGDARPPYADGDDAGQARHGPAFDGSDPQADALSNGRRRYVGGDLYRGRDAGRTLQSNLAGTGRLGNLLAVFGIAALTAWILIAIAGAEQFAMILQRFRHGG